jgi:ankyrin repeat protein
MTETAFNIAAATREELGLKVLQEVCGDAPDLYQLGKYISGGADLEQLDAEGNTPLLVATRRNHTGASQILITAGARLDAQDKNGDTPLMHADSHHSLAVLKDLLDRNAPHRHMESGMTREMWDRHMDNVRDKIAAAEAQRTHFAVPRPFSFKKPA